MVFDDVVANSWYDFRYDPLNNQQYRVFESYRVFTPTGVDWDWREYESNVVGTFNPAVWYRDVDVAAVSRQHAFIPRQISVGGASMLVGYLWAPYAPQPF
jgi:hypothetical protein